jgi:glycosyltransferase involved in cell wall biosynthesis
MSVCDVSVIIPNYNRTKLLERALRSVERQSSRPSEVIIVDDHSNPEKLAEVVSITKRFGMSLNLSLLVNDRNMGANYSRNRGINAAKSRFIAFLDSDDLWMPNKLTEQMAEIEKVKAYDSRPLLSATGRYRVDDQGDLIARQFGGKLLNKAKILRSNFIGTLSSVIVEASVARHVHGFNENLPACQDWDFFIRLTDYVQFVGIKEPLCIYVDHGEDRITLNNRKRLRSHLYIYRTHIKGFRNLSRSSKAELFRNIAEDYQSTGNLARANKFYAWHRSLRAHGLQRILVPRAFWFCLYRVRNAPEIKAERYKAYRKGMAALLRNPSEQGKVENDSKLIVEMMNSANS